MMRSMGKGFCTAVALPALVICLAGCGTGKETEAESAAYLPDESLDGEIGTSRIVYEDGDLYSATVLVTLDGQGDTLTDRDDEVTVAESDEGETHDSIGMTGQEYVSFIVTTRSYITEKEELSTFSIDVPGIPEMLNQEVSLDSEVLFCSIADGKITSGTYDTESAMEAIANDGRYREILSHDLEERIIRIVQ